MRLTKPLPGQRRPYVGSAVAWTVTVSESRAVPSGPVQFRVNVVVATNGPVPAEPDVGCVPLHPPPAMQDVALVDDQLSTAELPLVNAVGLTLSETVGGTGEGAVRVTVSTFSQ